jgi:hypothetical protein
MGVAEGKQTDKRAKNLLEEIMLENFRNLVKIISLNI